MIRVLVVDDSAVMRMLIRALIDNEPDIEVVGEACNGIEACDQVVALKPDIVTMDIRMPLMDGFEATEKIMAQSPLPILVVSASVNSEELKIAFNALEAGALGVIEKPPGLHGDGYERVKAELLHALRVYHEIKVVSRPAKRRLTPHADQVRSTCEPAAGLDVIAIGASTGGPAVLADMISNLPNAFPVPIVIVQHISEGFAQGLATWLDDISTLEVKCAEDNEVLQAGRVYIADFGSHAVVASTPPGLSFKLTPFDGDNRDAEFCPSIDRLFQSVAGTCNGNAVGVLLTGMGGDGACGLLAMRKSGCLTLAQDEESSVVYGMPKIAFDMGAVCEQVSGSSVSRRLTAVTCRENKNRRAE